MRSNVTAKIEYLASLINNLFHKKNIICFIGYNGVYLLAIKNRNIIESAFFLEKDYFDDMQEFRSAYKKFFKKYNKYYILFLIDHPRSSYKDVIIPVFNNIFESNNFNNFINENFRPSEIVAYNVYEKLSSREEIWKINVISVPFTAPINELHGYALTNKFTKYSGTYFLTLEFEAIIDKFIAKTKLKIQKNLIVFACITKTSGIKLIVKHNKHIMEQVSIPFDLNKSMEFISGLFQQSTEDIILKHKKYIIEHNLKVDVLFLAHQSLQKLLKDIKLQNARITYLKPTLINPNANDDDIYQEDLLLWSFERSNKHLATNWQLRTISTINIIRRVIFKLSSTLIFCLLCFIGVILFNTNEINKNNTNLNKKYHELSNKYRESLEKYPNLQSAMDKMELFYLEKSINRVGIVPDFEIKSILNREYNKNLRIQNFSYKLNEPNKITDWDKNFTSNLILRYCKDSKDAPSANEIFKPIIEKINVLFPEEVDYEIIKKETFNKKQVYNANILIKGRIEADRNAK